MSKEQPKAPQDWDGHVSGTTNHELTTIFKWSIYIFLALMGGAMGCITKDAIVGFWKGLIG